MNSTPAEMSEIKPMSVAIMPQMPGAGAKMKAAKWTAMRTQPVSQWREAVVWPRRATDANAHVSAATAARSGSLVQSTRGPQFHNPVCTKFRCDLILRMNEMALLLYDCTDTCETCVILRGWLNR